MAKANPKAWFTSPIAKITYRSVDRYASNMAKWRPYFDTWEEAHAWMRERGAKRLALAKKELKNAQNSYDRIFAMKAPNPATNDKE